MSHWASAQALRDRRAAAYDERHRQFIDRTEPYNQVVVDAGDVPWFRDPVKIARLEHRIPGIAGMTESERRRALHTRHTKRG